MHFHFVVIDEYVQTVEDEASKEIPSIRTVVLCETLTRMFKTIRVEPSMVNSDIMTLDIYKWSMRETLSFFWLSGITRTEELSLLESKGGRYFHKGVPEFDESFAALLHSWRRGGPRDIDERPDSDEEVDAVIEKSPGKATTQEDGQALS